MTVADDLLENDGQKFLEMMEQLAGRRMIREDQTTANTEDDGEDGGDDDDEEDDGDDEEDDGDEEEEVCRRTQPTFCPAHDICPIQPMTEDQRVEEGRKIFSIFAARMFEQRVLQAFREQVEQERQFQLTARGGEKIPEDVGLMEKQKPLEEDQGEEGEEIVEAGPIDVVPKAIQQSPEEEQKNGQEDECAEQEDLYNVQKGETQRKKEERGNRQAEQEHHARQERPTPRAPRRFFSFSFLSRCTSKSGHLLET